MTVLKIEDAKKEILQKSYLEIQKETAIKWASRAAASYELSLLENDKLKKMALVGFGEEYHHEAVEHAALYEDGGQLLADIEKAVYPFRDVAIRELHKKISS